jgi:bacterioferritin-associated ferredoxin
VFVCLCKGITDSQIKTCVNNGATTVKHVRRELGVASQCCKCLPEARAIINQQLAIIDRDHSQGTATSQTMYYPA